MEGKTMGIIAKDRGNNQVFLPTKYEKLYHLDDYHF